MAAVLDLMLVGAIAVFLTPLLEMVSLQTKFDILVALAYLFYEAVFLWAWKGQTPGRRVLGLYVLPGKGGELTLREAILRPGLRVCIFLLTLDLAYIWRYFDYGDLRIHVLLPIEIALLLSLPSRRTLADLVAGTIVVEAPPPQPHRAPAVPMYSASDGEFGLPAKPPGHEPKHPESGSHSGLVSLLHAGLWQSRFDVRAVLLAAVLAASPGAFANEKPPLPYYDWNACPFECCTYRAWRAKEPVKVRKARNAKAEPAFELRKGEWVRAVTGVVVTHRYGITKVLKPVTLGYRVAYPVSDEPLLRLQPGELLYTLHYLGEGFDLFWYDGQLYSDQIASEPDPPPADLNLQVLSRPRNVWWVKVRRKDGRVGWMDEPHKFGNVDACG